MRLDKLMNVKEIFETMEYGPAPENPQEALKWLESHGRKFGHFINGEFIKATAHFPTKNPSDSTVLADIGAGSAGDVDAAVVAARKAQRDWVKIGGAGRAKYLYAIARLVNKHARLFAVLETLDNGKPILESRDVDIPLVIRHFYHHAGWAQLMDSEMPGYEALGVAGQIIPWNFPLLMLAWKIAPAIAMGNTVVLKPAEFTSLTALLFAEICVEAGLPKGVVNIVTGDGATGAAITEHGDIDKIAFTGSTEVGRIIRKTTAGSGKKLTLELGGKSPFIVFDDADLDSAIEGVVDAIWFNQGQVCCAGSRLLVQETIAAPFLAKLESRMAKLRVGDPLDKCIDIGAIVDDSQLKTIQAMVAKGVAEGATLIQPETALPNGCFYPPTLLRDVEAADTVMQEEIFGPVLVSTTFRTPAEAIALANNTKYGLAASVWSENINLAYEIAPKIKAGVVWINCTNQFDAAAGFGGMRESGFGREGGREGLFEYVKPTYMKGLEPSVSKHPEPTGEVLNAPVDRTAKMYIGGKQARPDSGYSTPVITPNGALIAHVASGSRKDIRNAVEAAAKARGWGGTTGHTRAQILYYIAENLSPRAAEFAERIVAMTGVNKGKADKEVEAAITRLFTYAAWADKYDGAVHNVPMRGVAMAMHEPVGIMGIICPEEAPLLGLVSLIAPVIAMGNTCVVVPSAVHPLSATDFYQVLETSDLPGGVVNIVTGFSDDLGLVLAEHYEVDGLWHFGSAAGGAAVETASAASVKRTWVMKGLGRDWYDPVEGEGREFLRQATEVKNIWTPYGE